MSDAIYPKASKAPRASRPSKVVKASAPKPPAQPAEDYEDYEGEYDEYDEPHMQDGDEWEYEEEGRLIAGPGRAIMLGVAGVALLVVFSAMIWLLSTGRGAAAPPSLPGGAAGGVPVIQGFVQTSEAEAPAKGSFAPDFMWTDTNKQTVALSSFRGNKPVFLNFWGTWCPPCRQEMPLMETFYQQHKNDIQMISVSMYPRDDPTTVLNFVKDAKYSWKFIHDGDYKVAERYQVANIPSSYFIGTDGVIKAVQIGAMLNESTIEGYYQQVAPSVK